MLTRVRTYLFASLTPITMLLAVVASICLFSAPAVDSELAQVRVDAFEAGSWNGIVMVVDDQTSFQVRVGTQAEFGDYLDGDNGPDFFQESARKSIGGRKPGQWTILYRTAPLTTGIKEVGPHAPDGSYSHVAWNPLYPYNTGSRVVLEWARLDERSVLAKVTYTAPYILNDYNAGNRVADFVLEAYSPWDTARGMVGAKYGITEDSIFASSAAYRPVSSELEWNHWRFYLSSSNSELAPEVEPGRVQGFFKPSFNDGNWNIVRWGAYWQEDPRIGGSGYGWYRQRILIPIEWKGRVLRFELGKVAENDWTFLNGTLIGSESSKDVTRAYEVKPGDVAYSQLLWGQENVLAVQVRSRGAVGGMSTGNAFVPLALGRADPPPRPRVGALADDSKRIGFAVVASKAPSSIGTFDTLSDIQRQIQEKGRLTTQGGARYAALHFADLHEESKQRQADNVLYFLMVVGKEDAGLVTSAKQLLSRVNPDEILAARRAAYEEKRVRTTGEFAGAAEMAANTLHWSVLYGPEQKRAFVVDSRRWCIPNRWFLGGNSAVMSAWAAAIESKELAQNTLRGILSEAMPNGMVPNIGGSFYSTPNRTQDMYAAYTGWKIYTKYRDRKFLQAAYPQIKAWHDWWFADRGDGQPRRDGNRDGLLEIGSEEVTPDTPQDPPDSEAYGNIAQTAYWESFDDSPMYSNYERGLATHAARYGREPGVRFIYRTGTLNLDLVHVNALYALSAGCLARIAEELGYRSDAEEFRRQYTRTKNLMNTVLWDEKTGYYLNRFWDSEGGKFSYRKSPAHFWVLTAGIPDQRQAARMVKEHLLNPKEFWGDYVLPSISRDDPAFTAQYYWRGTIWTPLNYFVYEGLKRYGFDDEAAQLVKKTYAMVKANWDDTGALWENYNSINGTGSSDGAAPSTPHYSWAASLPLLAVMELIDVEAWGGLRFGSLGVTQGARVENVEIAGDRYAVQVGPETSLWQNGKHLFEADGPVVVRNFEWSGAKVAFRVKSKADSKRVLIRLRNLPDGVSAGTLAIDGKPSRKAAIAHDRLDFAVPGGEHSVEILVLPSRRSG